MAGMVAVGKSSSKLGFPLLADFLGSPGQYVAYTGILYEKRYFIETNEGEATSENFT